MKAKFKLKKTIEKYKKGEVFDSFGGLVSGISLSDFNMIRFDNAEYFELTKENTLSTNLGTTEFKLIHDTYTLHVCCKDLLRCLDTPGHAIGMSDNNPSSYSSNKHEPYVAFFDDGGHGGVHPIQYCPFCGNKIVIDSFTPKESF